MAAKKSTAAASKPSTDISWTKKSIAIVIAAVALGAAVQTHGTLFDLYGRDLGARHENKRFETYQEFFPFYLTEHSDATCKLLHVIGTTISTLFLFVWPMILPSLLTAVSVGFMLCELFAFMPNGGAEAIVMATIFFGMNRVFQGRSCYQVLLVGYLFAWIGHFFFEHNRPATFLYPSYSLASDYMMLFSLATGRIAMN